MNCKWLIDNVRIWVRGKGKVVILPLYVSPKFTVMNFRKINTSSPTFIVLNSLLVFLAFLAIILIFGSCRSSRSVSSEAGASVSQTQVSSQQAIEALTDSMLAQLDLDFDTLEFCSSRISDITNLPEVPDVMNFPTATHKIRIVNGKVRSHSRSVTHNASVTRSNDSVTYSATARQHTYEKASREGETPSIGLLGYILPVLILAGLAIYFLYS